jgi:lysophospholipase L1-like esterase
MGDSITRGNVSANYVHILSQRLFERDFILVNAGINAELSYNLLQRLDEIIACEPDYITILIGTNDADGTLSEATASRQMRQMKLPQKSTSAWFESNLQKIITELQTHTEAKIALLSIPPIGELNTLQAFETSKQFSEISRAVAGNADVVYLPLHEEMTAYIHEHPGSPKFPFEDMLNVMWKGIFQHYFLFRRYEEISARNGFSLLTDYLHLNETAAGMVADLIEDFVLNNNGPDA